MRVFIFSIFPPVFSFFLLLFVPLFGVGCFSGGLKQHQKQCLRRLMQYNPLHAEIEQGFTKRKTFAYFESSPSLVSLDYKARGNSLPAR